MKITIKELVKIVKNNSDAPQEIYDKYPQATSRIAYSICMLVDEFIDEEITEKSLVEQLSKYSFL